MQFLKKSAKKVTPRSRPGSGLEAIRENSLRQSTLIFRKWPFLTSHDLAIARKIVPIVAIFKPTLVIYDNILVGKRSKTSERYRKSVGWWGIRVSFFIPKLAAEKTAFWYIYRGSIFRKGYTAYWGRCGLPVRPLLRVA